MQSKSDILLIYSLVVLFLVRITNVFLTMFLDQIIWTWLLLAFIIISYSFSTMAIFYFGKKETSNSFSTTMLWSFMVINFTELILISTIVFATKLVV